MIKELRLWPNKISLIRIVLNPFLWLFAILHMRIIFVITILFAGFTDALDGFLARKLKQETKFGTWIDSFADNLLLVCSPVWVWLFMPNFLIDNIIIIITIFTLMILSLLLGYIKYRKMIRYHLYLNKIAAVLFYLFFIYALLINPNIVLFYVVMVFGGLGCIEEILITMTHDKMHENKLSIFHK